MTRHLILAIYVLAMAMSAATGVKVAGQPIQSGAPPALDDRGRVILIQDYTDGLSRVRAANPEVHLSIGRDPSLPGEPVLLVEYPSPASDPAGRDVQCMAENQDWTAGRAISFQIKADHPLRLSVSFIDRNHVVFTAWTDLAGGAWQSVTIPFDGIRPNPYFQPPDARTGAPIDVSEVKFLAFAPQDQAPGRLAIGRFVVTR
jgi:Carbohydrate binding domain (family 11)